MYWLTSAFTVAPLVARKVERLVGFHFHRLFLASLSEIVPAWFVTFVSSVVEVPLCARQLIIPDPTSAFTVAPLVARKVERLVGSLFHRLFLASLFQIVSAWFVTFVSLWWKVHCARGRQYIS